MSKSIISNEPACLVCGSTNGLHRHHIFFGTANRKKSEVWGCWCYLCMRHHTGSNYAVHGKYGHDLDMRLKERCQTAFESKCGTREDFVKIFGRSWL